MRKRIIVLSTSLFLFSGLAFANADLHYVSANAEEVVVSGSFINVTNVNEQGQFRFTMKENDAPAGNWDIRYKPESVDNITITQPDGTSYHIESAITQREAIVKYSATNYQFESWVYGDTRRPQEGDIITIEGNFNRVDGGVTTKLNIQKSSFLIGRDSSNNFYPINIPQTITNVNEKSTGFSMSVNSWWFLFNINGLSEEDAPITGDSYGYYPSSKECVYFNGNPIGKVDKHALRRRDPGSTEFYVVKQGNGEGQDFEPTVGDIVVFDGLFVTNVPNPNYEKSKSIGINLSLLAFEKIGTGSNSYKIIDLKQYLSDKLNSKFNINLFKDEVKNEVQDIFDDFLLDIDEAEHTSDVYQVFDNYSATLSTYEYDKESTKEALENYVDLNDYFSNEQTQIQTIINDAKTAIDEVTDNSEIYEIYEAAKTEIDLIKDKIAIMVSAIENQTEGYENYLEIYNHVSLSNLNLGDITYHGDKTIREEEDLNTNQFEQQLVNTFATQTGNENGNVIFQFKYVPNAVPVKGANAMIVLRGIPYYGYKFAIDTDSRGCYIEVLDTSNSDFYGGESNLFVNGNEYIVEVGAIDLLHDVNKTWIFVKVNGNYAFNKVVDSLAICSNPRVAVSPNGNIDADNDYEGEVVLSSYDENNKDYDSSYLGAFSYKENQEVSKQNIKLTLDSNAIPANATLYPLSNSSIKLIRNEITTEIAKPELGLINKKADKDYQLDLSKIVEIEDNDLVVIDGDFAYYEDNNKYSVTIAPSRYQYHENDNSWEAIFTLEEIKEDAKKKLANYLDLSKYDEDEVDVIEGIINTANSDIDNATTAESVNTILNQAKSDLDAVKTTLDKYKDSSIALVNSYKNDELDNYRAEEKTDIANFKRAAVEEINAATSEEEIDLIVVTLKSNIDDLKTDEEYKAEELEDAKKAATSKIRNHYASLDLSKYSQEEKQALDSDTQKALADIKTATSIDQINQIVDNYINGHQQKNPASRGARKCGGNIVITSTLLSMISLAGIILVLANKKKKYM